MSGPTTEQAPLSGLAGIPGPGESWRFRAPTREQIAEVLRLHWMWARDEEGGVRANLSGADLSDVDLLDVGNLTGANLTGAQLPDGRSYEQWRDDPLAGLCDDPESVQRAIEAWGGRTWADCPMHAAHGWSSLHDAPAAKRLLAAVFVALLDGGHLPRPEVAA